MHKGFMLAEVLVVFVTVLMLVSPLLVAQTPQEPLQEASGEKPSVTVTATTQHYQFAGKWGTAGVGPGQFKKLVCVVTDSSGLIYTAEQEGRISKFTADGKLLQVIGEYDEFPRLFGNINGLAVDRNNNIYGGDPFENRVLKVSNAGKVLAEFPGFYGGVAVDQNGNIYIHRECSVIKLSSKGNILKQWGGPGNEDGGDQNGELSPDFSRDLNDLAVDTLGNVYVCDTGNHRIQKFTSNGAFVAIVGGRGTEDGRFQTPMGIGVDTAGNIYVTDTGNGRVQKFTSDGQFVSKFGSTGRGDGQFRSPIDVAVDPMGSVYVADMGNSRIQKFRPAEAPAPPLPPVSTQPRAMEECLLALDGKWVYKGTSPSGFASPTNVQWNLLFERAWSEGSIAVSPDGSYIANVAYNTYFMPAESLDILTSQGVLVKNIRINGRSLRGAQRAVGVHGATWVDWVPNQNVLVLELVVVDEASSAGGTALASCDIETGTLTALSRELTGKGDPNLASSWSLVQYFWPSVSPQGDMIAYRWGKDLCVADYPSMANPRVITKSIETVDQDGHCTLSPPIRWRPDSSCVAAVIGGNLYIISLDGSKWHVKGSDGRAGWPSWSPNGSRLLWAASRADAVKVSILEISAHFTSTVVGAYSIGESHASSPDSGRARLMWVKLPKPGDQPGKLTVASNPPGAKIYIEGRLTGEVTPHTFDLKPGNYRIKVQPQFGGLQEQGVIVESGKEKKLEFVF